MQNMNASTKKTIPEFKKNDPVPVVETVEEIVVEKKHNYRLVVVNPFDRYMRGHVIHADQDIQAVIDNGKLRHCSKSI